MFEIRRSWLSLGLSAAGLATAVLLAIWSFGGLTSPFARSVLRSSDGIGGPFALTGPDGQGFTDRDFRGKWLLVYFGYTHCPDICPTTLADISRTLDILGPIAARVQPLFITIDPDRDTPPIADGFAKSFDDRIIGLSGSSAEIADVAREYRVFYVKRLEPSAPDGDSYLMDHTAFVYVMGADGRYVTLLSPLQGQTPDDMAARLRDLIGRGAASG